MRLRTPSKSVLPQKLLLAGPEGAAVDALYSPEFGHDAPG